MPISTQVSVDFFQRINYSHPWLPAGRLLRLRKWQRSQTARPGLRGQDRRQGLAVLRRQAMPTDGNLILRAKAVDDGGRPAVSHHDVWVGKQRRLVVHRQRQRPHRSAAREEALRTGRASHFPGPLAVP
ncbi:hypothetical protein LP419_06685 [Massilia sp. H-1]|nr:hypothetical protein LP419_06685 [Massilia sp. H-1]